MTLSVFTLKGSPCGLRRSLSSQELYDIHLGQVSRPAQPASGGTKKDTGSPFGIQHGAVNARKQDVLDKIIILLFSAARQSVL